MFKVENNVIHITRGDSAIILLSITDSEGLSYEVKETDEIVLTVKRNTQTKEIIFQKHFKNAEIKIDPKDTNDLSYGHYLYDVQLTSTISAEPFVETIIPPSLFIVESEVTFQ